MVFRQMKIFVIIAVLVMFFAANAIAAGSGAFRLELPHAEGLGKGSAFVGQADNPSAIYYNPAGLTQIEGNQAVFGMSFIQPRVEFENTSGDKNSMNRQSFWIPHVYVTSDFGLENFSFGLGGSSFWGLGTAWDEDGLTRYDATKSDVSNRDAMLAGAYRVNDKFSVGVGLDYDHSTANKSKRLLQAGGEDGYYQMKGTAQGFGYRLSSLYKLNRKHQVGLMYRSSIQEKYRGMVTLDNLNTSGSNYYALMGNVSSFQTPVDVENELPQSVVAGYSYRPSDKWLINFDVEWMDWSSVEQEGIVYKRPLTAAQSAVLNNGNPSPRDWKSVMSAGVGVEYACSDRLRLRGGYFFHETPMPDANFQASLPDSNSHSVTAGFGFDIKKDVTLDLAYAGMFFDEREVTSGFASGTIDGKYKNFTNLVSMTVGYKF